MIEKGIKHRLEKQIIEGISVPNKEDIKTPRNPKTSKDNFNSSLSNGKRKTGREKTKHRSSNGRSKKKNR